MSVEAGFMEKLRNLARLISGAVYDARRFWRASFTNGPQSRENLRARITMDCHFLEYGQSLRGAEAGHGKDRARRLVAALDELINRYGPDAASEIGLKALAFWVDVNRNADIDMEEFSAVLGKYADTPQTALRGGIRELTRSEIRQKGMMDFVTFAESRFSVRDYAPDAVPVDSLLRAVRVAQRSPSSCNRQTCRAHMWTDPQAVQRILALQSGNRGFGHLLTGIAIVTSELENWEQAFERYQGWVDGGMFAMSFCYGLHAEGLGGIMLNWSAEPEQDRALRRLINLPDSELVVVMVGFGSLPESFKVPMSERRPLEMAYELNIALAD